MTPSNASPSANTGTPKVAVAIPMPSDPPWELFDHIPDEIPILVCDDSNGKLAPPPRSNVTYYDYAAQEAFMGKHYPAIPHKSAAARNFAHYLAYQEGYDIIIALDYDCRTREGWLQQHLDALQPVTDAPALSGHWINSIECEGFYSRGYPYEYRNPVDSIVTETTASGDVMINMGVWDHILDLNGIDKLQKEPPYDPGLRGDTNYIALGNIPVCGMNTAFRAEITPAYFFLPDVYVNGVWQLSRHDDIWGGYIVKKLMDKRDHLFAYGRPIVEHTRQTPLERVVVMEHYMSLTSVPFYTLVDAALERVKTGSYAVMFADLTEEFLKEATRSNVPSHYREVFIELGQSMQRWAACFND